MKQYISGNSTAIVILHEIYGLNDFMKDIAKKYHQMGCDIFCPNFYEENQIFPYDCAEKAYAAFMSKVGFDHYTEVNTLIIKLKETYDRVFVLGFSVGATIAWRCAEHVSCNGVICCYGSRIRDYYDVMPKCPTYLIFAQLDSFDVLTAVEKLQGKELVEVTVLNAKHGFLDPYSVNYAEPSAQAFHARLKDLVR